MGSFVLLVDDDGDEAVEDVDAAELDIARAESRMARRRLAEEVKTASDLWWLRRHARRKTLKRLAQEAAAFGPTLRRRCAELRATAAKRRLELLQTGRTEDYAAMLKETKEQRLQEILEETKRILADLSGSCADLEVEQPKALARGQLMPHQMKGLRWMARLVDNEMSGILADDMGLGKTVQTLALLAFLAEHRQQTGPHLVVSPMSTMQHWCDEILQWLPDFRFLIYRGSASHLAAVEKETLNSRDVNIVLTNYETMAMHDAFLGNFPWCCLVVDEGHRIKNHKANASQVVRRLPCRHRLLLTGTPVQNSLQELWSLLSFVAPSAFSSLENFQQWFALPAPPSLQLSKGTEEEEEDMEATATFLSKEEELLIIQRLHGVLRPFLLRRTKEQVLADLPLKTEVVLWVPLTHWQKVLYRKGLRTVQRMAPKRRRVNATVKSCLVLRKAVNHPYHYLAKKASSSATEELITASGKFEFLDRFLPRLAKLEHKVLIFAQMTSSLDLIEKLLQRQGLRFTRIDGSKSLRQRGVAISTFCQEAVPVMLLTTRAGGLGLNLQAADTVILFDSDWNPQADLQASDRAHRIGQTRPVLVVRLMTPTALDRGLLERNGRKLELEHKVIRAGNFSQENAGQKLLKELLTEAKAKTGNGSSRPTSLDEVNRLMARNAEELREFQLADKQLFGFTPSSDAIEEQLQRAGRLKHGQGRLQKKSARAVVDSLAKRRKCLETK